MTTQLKYIGSIDPYFETTVTGASVVWHKGAAKPVPDANVGLLMATGLFAYADSTPVTAFTNPVTGGIDGLSINGKKSKVGDVLIQKILGSASAAIAKNPVDTPPLTPPPAYATGIAYQIGNVVTNAGSQYICGAQMTSSTTAPTGTGAASQGGVAPIADSTGYWIYQGATRTTVSSPYAPVVGYGVNNNAYANTNAYSKYDLVNYFGRTYTAIAARLANQAGDVQGQYLAVAGYQLLDRYDAVTNATSFFFSGGVPTLGGTATIAGQTINYVTMPCANGGTTFPTVSFDTSAPYIVIPAATAYSPNNGLRVEVDGVRLIDSQLNNAAGSQCVLDFSAQPIKSRTIRIVKLGVLASVNCFGGVFVSAGHKVYPTKNLNRYRMGWVGDSLIAGGGSPVINNPSPDISVPGQVGALLGCDDVWNFGIGGTGYIAPGSFVNQIAHISDVINAAPDIVIMAGAYNDGGYTVAAQTAAFLLYMQTLRASLPNVIIVVSGQWQPVTDSIKLATEGALLAAFNSFADARSVFIPVINDLAGAWNDGAGNVTTAVAYPPTATGGAQYFTGSDGIHQSVTGVDYMARRFATAIKDKLLTFSA
jgi:hypothetical protein